MKLHVYMPDHVYASGVKGYVWQWLALWEGGVADLVTTERWMYSSSLPHLMQYEHLELQCRYLIPALDAWAVRA